MSKRVFVSHIVPKELVETLNVSPAANYFSYNLIEGNLFDEIISLVPTNIDVKLESPKHGIKYIQTRLFGNKGLIKLLNVLIDNLNLSLKIKKGTNVWFYNLTYQTIISYVILRYMRRNVKTFIIVLDYTPSIYIYSIQNMILKAINNSNGIVSLTNNPNLKIKNKIVLPGFIPDSLPAIKLSEINNKFLLSGFLTKNRCPELILKVFSRFPEYELIITGIIENEVLIKTYVSEFPNIKYLGLLNYNEYLNTLKGCTFSINSRDPTFLENHYNFPSKSIEHLSHNKIIISTMEYEELDGINYFYVPPRFEQFEVFLEKLVQMDKRKLIENYANQSNKVAQILGKDSWEESMTILENPNIHA